MSVNLTKGQKVSLTKRGGGSLSLVRMGLGWDAVKKRGLFGSRSQSIDLDASALLFDAGGNLVDAVWFRQLRSRDGSVQHTGDNLTGAGEGDDESVIVDLARLSPAVTQIVFTVNSFTGRTSRRSRTRSAGWSTRRPTRSWPATSCPAPGGTTRRSWPR